MNIVGSQDGYFSPEATPGIVRTHSRQRGENRHRRDGVAAPGNLDARLPSGQPGCALYGRRRHLRCFYRPRSSGAQSLASIWGWSGSIACFLNRAVSNDRFRLLRYFTLALFRENVISARSAIRAATQESLHTFLCNAFTFLMHCLPFARI